MCKQTGRSSSERELEERTSLPLGSCPLCKPVAGSPGSMRPVFIVLFFELKQERDCARRGRERRGDEEVRRGGGVEEEMVM